MNKKVEPFLVQALSKLKMRCLYVLIISIYRLINIDDSVVCNTDSIDSAATKYAMTNFKIYIYLLCINHFFVTKFSLIPQTGFIIYKAFSYRYYAKLSI